MITSPLSFDFTVDDPDHQGLRVDLYLADEMEILTRSQLKARLSNMSVNGCSAKLSRKLELGDTVHLELLPVQATTVNPEDIELDILYENDDVVVVHKPQGMVVHPANGNYTGTLVQGLLFRYSGLRTEFQEPVRPGIIHRLDKDTSGVIIAAKNASSHEFLSRQFRKKRVEKKYLAIVKGSPAPSTGIIEKPLARDPHNRKRFRCSENGGKTATTEYKTLCRLDKYSFLVLKPKTGRTHQLRVHMLSLGTPIVGDPLYSRKVQGGPGCGLMLHAYRLKILLPGEKNPRTFRAPLPERFKQILRLRKD